MEKFIRKIIRESLLDEDYESIQEMRTLTSDALEYIAKKNIDDVTKWANGELRGFFISVSLKEIYEENKGKYTKLVGWLENSEKTRIYIENNTHVNPDDKVQGTYSHLVDKSYNPKFEREIELYYDDNFLKDLKSRILDYTKSYNKPFSARELYLAFHFPFNSPLLHELQHNYDDFRSDSKMYSTKQFRSFIELSQRKKAASKHEFLNSHGAKYLNLPHEIWARFSQTIDKIMFASSDFVQDERGRDYLKSEMKPLQKIVREFKWKFVGFHILPDDMKKRLIRKISQFWHIEQDKINKENANPEYF